MINNLPQLFLEIHESLRDRVKDGTQQKTPESKDTRLHSKFKTDPVGFGKSNTCDVQMAGLPVLDAYRRQGSSSS